MSGIKLTSKRQATFPNDLCEDLGVGPGSQLKVEKKILDGEIVWVLQPLFSSNREWFKYR